MAEFYSDEEVRRMCKPRLLASAAVTLALLSLLATGMTIWMLLFHMPQRVKMIELADREAYEKVGFAIELVKTLQARPYLAWLGVIPPLISLGLAYMWRCRLMSLLSILISLVLIAAPILIVYLGSYLLTLVFSPST
jgi:hypothetical protein